MTKSVIAPPIIMLHGQPGSKEVFVPLIEELKLRGLSENHSWDRPGYASSDKPAMPIFDQISYFEEKIKSSFSEPIYLVGHSFGGTLAIGLGAVLGKLIKGIVLIAPATQIVDIKSTDRLLQIPYLGDASALIGLNALRTSAKIYKLLNSTKRRNQAFNLEEALCPRPLSKTLKAFMVEERSLLRDLPKIQKMTTEIDVPTAVIYGREDKVINKPSIVALNASLMNSNIVYVDRASHLVVIEKPGEIAAEIQKLVSSGTLD